MTRSNVTTGITGIALEQKERTLRQTLRGYGRVLVAFSGGIDSAVLLRVAVDELGSSARAALAIGPSLPERDRTDALDLAARIGVRLELVETAEMSDDRYLQNGKDRCYWCRSALVDALRPLAADDGSVLVYGPVADDLDEDRPGMQAAAAGGFRAPLLDAGFTKDDVRAVARRLDVPFWDKPSSACLASRVTTGIPITAERLARVERAETALRALGFIVLRVRDHEDLARIEVGADEIPRLLDAELRDRASRAVRDAGFRRVSVDLDGYRPAGTRHPLPAL